MRRFRHILVHVRADAPQDPALHRAADLARRTGARLTLTDTFEPVAAWLEVRARRLAVTPDILEGERRALLEDLAAPLRAEGLSVCSLLLRGAGPQAVLRQVHVGRHDLVMKTARGEAFGPWAFGGVARTLMRVSSAPVWVVGPEQRTAARNILVALDPDPRHPTRDALSRHTLELARAMAEADGASLHVVHAWSPFGQRLLSRRAGEVDAQALTHNAEALAARDLEEAISPLGWALSHPRVHLRRGDPEEVICATLDAVDADLMVLGMVGRSGPRGVLLGNTAEKVLQRARCSLLAVKPVAAALAPARPTSEDRRTG